MQLTVQTFLTLDGVMLHRGDEVTGHQSSGVGGNLLQTLCATTSSTASA